VEPIKVVTLITVVGVFNFVKEVGVGLVVN